MAKVCQSPIRRSQLMNDGGNVVSTSAANHNFARARSGTLPPSFHSSSAQRRFSPPRSKGFGTKRKAGEFGASQGVAGSSDAGPLRKRERTRRFLFGGNVNDPLNLNSLGNNDERSRTEVHATDAVSNTDGTADGPVADAAASATRDVDKKVEVVIPKYRRDPLNLEGKSRQRPRKRRKRTISLRLSEEKDALERSVPRSVVTTSSFTAKRRQTISESEVEVTLQRDEVTPARVASKNVRVFFAETKSPPPVPSYHLATAGMLILPSSSETTLFRPTTQSSSMRIVSSTAGIVISTSAANNRKRTFSTISKDSVTNTTTECEALSKRRRCSSYHSSQLRVTVADEKFLDTPVQSSANKTGLATSTGNGKSSQPAEHREKESKPTDAHTLAKEKMKAKFRYGNYNGYYGYRLEAESHDPRLQCIQLDWIENRDVLDIGCNSGEFTLALAKNLRPRKIVGIDIDGGLIGLARKNVRRFLDMQSTETSDNVSAQFPPSFPKLYGPISAPPVCDKRKPIKFPQNVMFKQANFVLANDALLDAVKPEFDTVLALSVTKWIHLNWGDDGLRRFFKRAFLSLRPGGLFILEPQPFASYQKRRNLAPELTANFVNIRFRPEQFNEYLLSKDVGFSTCQIVGMPQHSSKGFSRPIYRFTKPYPNQPGAESSNLGLASKEPGQKFTPRQDQIQSACSEHSEKLQSPRSCASTNASEDRCSIISLDDS